MSMDAHNDKSATSSRLTLLAPDLRYRDTVPWVVGCHMRVVDLPAVAMRPEEGILNGFGPSLVCANARNGALSSATRNEREKYMVLEYDK